VPVEKARLLPLLGVLGGFLCVELLVGSGLFWARDLVLVAVMASASYAASQRRDDRNRSVALLIAAAATRLVAVGLGSRQVLVVSSGLALLFVLQTSWAIYRSVLDPGRSTRERIRAAIAVYMLAALAWAVAYSLIDQLSPGSFRFAQERPPSVGGSPVADPALVYLSFVTLTTLGYGDVTPLSHAARTLAWIEALFGQLYLATTIASLVGVGHSPRPSQPGS
jgi:voltage-gated potassium channel